LETPLPFCKNELKLCYQNSSVVDPDSKWG
jgi:hypothetical protein